VGSAGHRLPLLRDISKCTSAFFFKNRSCLFSSDSLDFSSILDQSNVGNSNFNSLQVRFETHNFHGLQLGTSYQWAKSIDNASSLQPQVFLQPPLLASFLVSSLANIPDLGASPENFAGANNISPTLNLEGNLPLITTRPRLPQDGNNLAGERSVSDFDIRHRFVLSYTYAVPRWAPRIGAGWRLAGNTTIQSGQPFTVYGDYFGIPLRPNVSGPVPINTKNPRAVININNFDFTPTFRLQPGSLGRNAFTGPKLMNFDFALVKDTHLWEANLQLRAEFFNIFNKANFRQPYSRAGEFFSDLTGNFAKAVPKNCTTATPQPGGPDIPGVCSFEDPFFGQILQAFSARQIQFALKLIF
jgi:hypothetical protein